MPNLSCSSGEKKPLELPPLPLGSVAPNWSQFWVHQVIKGTRGELAKIEIEISKNCCLVEGQGAKTGRLKKYDWGREGRTCVQLWARSSTEQHLPTGQSLGLETVETAPVPPLEIQTSWPDLSLHQTFCQVNFFLASRPEEPTTKSLVLIWFSYAYKWHLSMQ